MGHKFATNGNTSLFYVVSISNRMSSKWVLEFSGGTFHLAYLISRFGFGSSYRWKPPLSITAHFTTRRKIKFAPYLSGGYPGGGKMGSDFPSLICSAL
jgi:hypothetical protein